MGSKLFVVITSAWLVGVGPLVAAQETAPVIQGPSASCSALLQHPLAWWLSSAPTASERDQVTVCLAGSGRQAPASPSGSAAPSTTVQNKPANWNTLNADEQATFLRLEPKTWAQMTEQEHKDWYRILRSGQAAQTTAFTPPVSSPAPVARWTPDTCDSARQTLSLLSQRINQSLTQLQILSAMPPVYHVNPPPPIEGSGAAAARALQEALAQRAAASRFDAVTAQIQTQQNEFDTRVRELESNCTKR